MIIKKLLLKGFLIAFAFVVIAGISYKVKPYVFLINAEIGNITIGLENGGKTIFQSSGDLTKKIRIESADGENNWVSWIVETGQLYINKYDSDGNALLASPIITSGVKDRTADEWSYRILSDGDGGLYVAYLLGDNAVAYYGELRLQRIDSNGNFLWGASGISVEQVISSSSNFPVFERTASGVALLYVPSDGNTTSAIVKHTLQKYDSNGGKLLGDAGLDINVSTDYSDQQLANMAIDSSDNIVISINRLYDDAHDLIWGSDIGVYKINSSNQQVWGNDGISIAKIPIDGLFVNPRISVDSAGNSYVYWYDERFGWQLGEVFTQKISSDGTLLWENNDFLTDVSVCGGTSSNPGGTKYNPELNLWSDDPDCSTAVACTEFQRPYDFYDEDYIEDDCTPDSTCTCFWTASNGLQVSEMGTSSRDLLYDNPHYDTLEGHVDLQGNLFIPWASQSGTQKSIFMQKLSSAGAKLWGDNGKIFSNENGYAYNPEIINLKNEGFLASWKGLNKDSYGVSPLLAKESVFNELIELDGSYLLADYKSYDQMQSSLTDRRWCSNAGGAEAVVDTIPFDVPLGDFGWDECWNWCAANMGSREICQYNGDGPRNCWIKTAPGLNRDNCVWTNVATFPLGGPKPISFWGIDSHDVSGEIETTSSNDFLWKDAVCTGVNSWTSGDTVYMSTSNFNLDIEKSITVWNEGYEMINASAVDTGGKIYLTGQMADAYEDRYFSEPKEMLLIRKNADLTDDATFNSPLGYVKYESEFGESEGLDIVIQEDGKIVVAGVIDDEGGSCRIAIWRYNSNGIIDDTFGNSGVAIFANLATSAPGDRAMALTLLEDGSYLVTGHSQNEESYTPDMVLLKLDSDGNLDDTFGDGTCNNGVGDSNAYGCVVKGNVREGANLSDKGFGIAVDADGKIVVVGKSSNEDTGYSEMVVWRFLSNGEADESFGDGNCHGGAGQDGMYGCLAHAGLEQDCSRGWDLAFDGEKIVVVGQSKNALNSDIALWRLNSNGTMDSSFGGGDGFVIHDNAAGGDGGDRADSLIIMPDGKYLVGGRSFRALPALQGISGSLPVIWKFKSDGDLDPDFGDGSCNNGVGDEGKFGCMVFDDGAYDINISDSKHGGDLLFLNNDTFLLAGGIQFSPYASDVGLWKVEDLGTGLCPAVNWFMAFSEEEPPVDDEDPGDDVIDDEDDSEGEDDQQDNSQTDGNDEDSLARTGISIIHIFIATVFAMTSIILEKIYRIIHKKRISY